MYYYDNVVFFTGEDWCKTFYWTVDSLASPDGKNLRKIETEVFRSQRGVILKELRNQKWKGTKDQNRCADEKVSNIIRKALEFD